MTSLWRMSLVLVVYLCIFSVCRYLTDKCVQVLTQNYLNGCQSHIFITAPLTSLHKIFWLCNTLLDDFIMYISTHQVTIVIVIIWFYSFYLVTVLKLTVIAYYRWCSGRLIALCICCTVSLWGVCPWLMLYCLTLRCVSVVDVLSVVSVCRSNILLNKRK